MRPQTRHRRDDPANEGAGRTPKAFGAVLARSGRTITQAEWVKELKRVSNLWLKERCRDHADFGWQRGYAVFSVSQSNLEQVKQYIARSEEHHRKVGFQDKLRALFRKREVEWDEKYVWD